MVIKKPVGSMAMREYTSFPKEALEKTLRNRKILTLGIPKETSFQENRIGLTPRGVSAVCNSGYEVKIEANSGIGSKFQDTDYVEAGAEIVYSPEDVFQCDIVVKVEPPTPDEINLLKKGNALISAVQIGNLNPDYINSLTEKKTTAIAIEMIEDKVGSMPMVRAMSEIAGNTVPLIASEYLSSVNDGKGIILGGITGVPPTEVIILGAGTVAEYAARTALGLGADVKVFDNHIYKLERLKRSLGNRIYTSTLDNYILSEALINADVVIGALRANKGRTPCVVSEEMVAAMQPGSVIIDVSIDQGGCFETSQLTDHNNPTFIYYDVIHYCVPNIASRVARTASNAMSNILTPFLTQTGDIGGVDAMVFDNPGFMRGVYMYKGSLTNIHIARKFNMGYKDLKLIMAARF